MPLSLNNSKDLIANSLGLISGNEILDVGNNIEAFALALAGKAPQAAVYTKQETYSNYQINSLFDAVDDELDAVQDTLGNKADKAGATFTGTVVAPNITLGTADLQTTLNNKAGLTDPLVVFTGTVSADGLQADDITLGTADLQTTLNGKQGVIQTTDGAKRDTDFGNYQRVQTDNNKFIIQRLDATGVASDEWKDQVKLLWSDSQKKTYVTVDHMIVNDHLTVSGEDLMAYAKTSYVNNEILEVYDEVDTKVDKFNPTFVGVVTMPNGSDLQAKLDEKAVKTNPTLTGTVTINGTNLLTMFDERAPKASPTFTGTLTTPAITLNGTNLATTLTNMDNSINAKQNQIQSLNYSNGTYATALGNQKQILTDGPRLIIQHNNFSISQPGSGQWLDLLETTWDTVSNIATVSTPGILTANLLLATTLNCMGSATVAGNTNLIGNLSVTGFYPHKPYVALLVGSNGAINANVGYIPSEQITISIASSNAYTIAFPAHPNGSNFLVHVDYKTGASSNALYIPTCNNSQTSINVWLRSATNTIHTGNFYVHTVP